MLLLRASLCLDRLIDERTQVIRFYQAMGSLMGHKLENLRQQTPDSQQRWQHLQQQNQQQPFLP
jgi:hypothetical protein